MARWVLERAARGVSPKRRELRYWFHKIGNLLAALPKSAHLNPKKALAEIWNAEDRLHSLDAATAFDAAFAAKFPKLVAKITEDVDQLLAFYDFPSTHQTWSPSSEPEPASSEASSSNAIRPLRHDPSCGTPVVVP